MTRVTPFPDNLTRELSRLHAVETAALLSRDMLTFVHSRLRWCELVTSLNPAWGAAAPSLARTVASLLPQPPQPVARWKLELRARPLVPIVRRRVRTSTLPSGSLYRTAEETLACGHVHSLSVVLDGDLRARRRRCRQCGSARLAALARRALTQVSVPAATAAAIPVRKGGRGESPEPLRRAAPKQPGLCLVPSR